MQVNSYKDFLPSPNIFRNTRFLIVDDIELNLTMLRYFIEDIGGIVTFAENGLKALNLVRDNTYDVIIMDIHMPQMNGIEATMEIRKLEKGRDIPIIGLSADVLNNDNKACKEAGMTDFIPKPLEFKKIINILQKILHPTPFDLNKPDDVSTDEENKAEIPDNSLKLLDFEAYVKRMGGNREIAVKIIIGFIKQVPVLIENIESAIKTGNTEIIHREAHSIKGGASNIFAEILRESAKELEMNAKSDNIPFLINLLNKIKSDFQQLNEYAMAILSY
jgi:two-component system, sensor histidine kinase and response regulator